MSFEANTGWGGSHLATHSYTHRTTRLTQTKNPALWNMTHILNNRSSTRLLLPGAGPRECRQRCRQRLGGDRGTIGSADPPAAAAVPFVGQAVLAQAVLCAAQGGKQLYDLHWETQMCFMAYDNRFPPRHVSLGHFNSSNPGLSPAVYAALLTPSAVISRTTINRFLIDLFKMLDTAGCTQLPRI